ncbi:hypothetical protein [Niallia sp. BSM11]|uniref:hypothetical protein n=1 Tax=Niallia sp. BSM11 TaxID=3391576 RepID=UPI003985058D
MFDPTAYDNLKTVVEGQLYDRDLEGTIDILNRKDILDTSTMSREFHLVFALRGQQNAQITLSMYASLKNLAAELLELEEKMHLIGAEIRLTIHVRHKNNQETVWMLQDLLQRVWGAEHVIKQEIRVDPFRSDNIVNNHISIDFSRLVTEGDMDDLVSMTDYMLATLAGLQRQKVLIDLDRKGMIG